MLCPNCMGYTYRSTAGTCEKCSAATPNYYNRLCTQCSTDEDECEICRTNMGTKGSCSGSTGKPSNWVIKKATKDNGGKVSLQVGDELEITIDESRSKEWFTGSHDSSLISETQRCDFLQGQNYSQGTRTLKFKAKAKGTTTLELDEWQMRWEYSHWGGSSGYIKDKKTGSNWKITVTVK